MFSGVKILILRRGSGNCGNVTTADRLRNYLLEVGIKCECVDTRCFNPKECQNFDAVIAIHAYHCAPILKECLVPYLIIFGGTDLNEYSRDQKCFGIMTNVICKANNLITFGSSMTQKVFHLWPNICKERINEIPQAVYTNPSRFNLKNYLDKNYNILVDKIFLLVLGVRRVKDPLFLVKDFSEWHDKHRDCWMIIIGSKMEDDYFQEVSENISRARGILLLPQLPQHDVHATMRDSFAVINCSQSEGMCSSILEAMDLYVPVIARDIPGNRDLIEDRVTGLLYKTPKEFLNAAEELMNDHSLKNILIENAKQQINRKHLCSTESKLYLELIHSMLSETS
ncbi:glycosyltransferase 1 domain-containing protein 1-like isoform X1 [Centruroides sculpturatus]|uniref:glycosyltransferase 1 domain-containing protein 1-like isoform X1 n=1 Tax=Centruroides sculpturatus TaxID=218467 RepID=UPI000C6D6495|nr:glycosyltransferase 1 domain-containing protein 1-like isoform X1 [Centruroides sculpturatus]XP_023210143.1 glycosyltransferase 1 domain-containing protein 1-like isoform X1 [Centruroides sculpturatus]XP_023210144.1 glycosyltransferase 1 domain-containing protein 1-like isoform X1 [Centruroides sculpturatus]